MEDGTRKGVILPSIDQHSASTEIPSHMTQIQKQQFLNTTEGWVGVTVIGPKGDERGAAVEPNGTVWLSEPEQVLTANAHRRAEDNPFIEQTLTRTNPDTGEQEDVKVTPLVPCSEERYVPAQARFIPGVDGRPGAVAQQAATGPEPVVAVPERKDALTRHEEVAREGEGAQPNVPPKGEALPPSLTPDAPQSPTPPAEETAAEVDPAVGEETGAAPPPTGAPPEGEYAAREEVGTPVERQESGSTPAPYSPPEG